MPDLFPASKDWSLAHPLLKPRYGELARELMRTHGLGLWVNEIYRPDRRQGWLYGQGRTPEAMIAKGLDSTWARTGAIVTNAWSAKTSAHGYVLPLCTAEWPNGVPASCALDVVPLGPDNTPWTKDDDWDLFTRLTTDPGSPGWRIGLVHFHRPGIAVWDRPHLQLREYSDLAHDLIIGA